LAVRIGWISFSKSTGAGCVVCPKASPEIRQSRARAVKKPNCLISINDEPSSEGRNALLDEIPTG